MVQDDAGSDSDCQGLVIKVLVVTLGGERKRVMERLLQARSEELSAQCGARIQVSFCPGVDFRDVHFERYQGIKHGGLGAVAADVLDDLKLDPRDVADWNRSARRLEVSGKVSQLAVLGCAFAQLRALREACSLGVDLILEDNCRIRADPASGGLLAQTVLAVRKARKAAALEQKEEECTEAGADFVYYGWLGHHDNLDTVHMDCKSADNDQFLVPLGMGVGRNGKGSHLLYGSYAYSGSKRLYDAILSTLRAQPRLLLPKKKNRRRAPVLPADHILRSITHLAGLSQHTARSPCFVRAPCESVIHPEWDARNIESTGYQLAQENLSWHDVALDEGEAELARFILDKAAERRAALERAAVLHRWEKRQRKYESWRIRKIDQGAYVPPQYWTIQDERNLASGTTHVVAR